VDLWHRQFRSLLERCQLCAKAFERALELSELRPHGSRVAPVSEKSNDVADLIFESTDLFADVCGTGIMPVEDGFYLAVD